MRKNRIIRSAIALLVAASLCGCNNRLDNSSVIEANLNDSTIVESGAESSLAVESSSDSILEVTPPEDTEPAYVDWMHEEKVHEIRIEMAPEEWKKICANPRNGDYHPADVRIDGTLVENVGVRTRGKSSLNLAVDYYPGSRKFPFKIKFDKYDKDQTFMGLDELALNNGGTDNSFLREYIGYEAYRLLGEDASCVTFFNVYVNDELRGFYLGVEAIDKSYLERLFGSHKNNLYESEMWASLKKDMPLSCLTQKKGKDLSKDDVKRLVNVLAETPLGEKGEIESIIDVDSVLRLLAINAVLDNWDGYGGKTGHNYYLYNNDGKFVMLPWDVNAPSVSPFRDIEAPTITGEGYSNMNNRPLVKKLLAVEEYYALYLGYCKQLNDKLPELKDTVLRLYAMIKESVEKDTHKFCTNYYFNSFYSENISYGVVYFLTNRYTYLTKRLKQLEGKPISQSALNPPPPPPPPAPSSGVDPTTSGADPTTNGEDPTTSGEDPTTSGEAPTTSGEDPTTSGEDPTTSGEDPTTSVEDPTTSGEDPTTSVEASTTSGEDPTTSEEPPTTSGGESA